MWFYYFYGFVYLVGLKQRNWWANGHDDLLLRREKGRSCEPKSLLSCASHIQSHASLIQRSNVMTCIPWFSLLNAVRWHLKSRLTTSRELKPCSSQVSFRFSQGIKDSGIFPKCYIKKTTYLGLERDGERRRRGGLRQRSSRGLEIDSSNISLIRFVLFSLYYSWILF